MANDIASLGISVTSTGAQAAATELDNLSASSGRAEKSTANLTGGLGLLKGALAGMVASFSIGAVGRVADEWSDLSSRVDLAAGSVEKGTAVMGRLQKMANATYSSLRATTEGYIANATTLRGMGKSTQEALDYTEALNNAMVVSGAKAERAAAVQGALSKAMALGKLSGDNLNTVIQQGGRVAELLAEKLGTTVPGLIAMGQQGKITGEVITSSLIGSMEKLAEEADSMPATIGDAFQRIQNNVLSFIGTFDQAAGSSGALAEVLLTVADNVDRIIVAAGTAVIAYGTLYVGAMVLAAAKTATLTGALTLLKGAIIKTGVGALAVVVGELVYQLIEARKASDSWGEAFAKLGGRLYEIWDGVKTGWSALVEYMQSLWYKLMANVYQSTDKMVTGLMRLFGISAADAEAFGAEYALMGETAGKNALDGFNKSAKQIKDAFRSFQEELTTPLDGDGGGGSGALGEVGGGKGGGKSSADRAAEKIAREMERRLEALKEGLMTEEETVLAQYEKDLETLNWHLENKKMSEQEYLDWREQVEADHWQKMNEIRMQQYVGALDATADFFGALSSLQEGGNAAMLKAQKVFAAASALVNAYLAASQALADPTIPFWGKFAAVAAVIAKGVSLVAAIKSGGGSSGGGGGSSKPQVSAAPPEQKPTKSQAVEIKLHGEVFTKQAVAALIGKINDGLDDGLQLHIRTV